MREPTNEVEIESDVKVAAADGIVLLTDVYHPVGVRDAPTILERTPYGPVKLPILQLGDGEAGSHRLSAPGVGLEPTTFRLTAERSAD